MFYFQLKMHHTLGGPRPTGSALPLAGFKEQTDGKWKKERER